MTTQTVGVVRPIPALHGYEADDAGRIWSIRAHRLLAAHRDPHGYLNVRVTVEGKRIKKVVHPLVCAAFHGAKPPGHEVRHLNGDKADNSPLNLKWGTPIENAADRDAHGHTATGQRNGTPRGSAHKLAKLTEDQVRRIRAMSADGQSPGAIARSFNVSRPLVIRIVQRIAWPHVQ